MSKIEVNDINRRRLQNWINRSGSVKPMTNSLTCIDDRRVATPVHFITKQELSYANYDGIRSLVLLPLETRGTLVNSILARRNIQRGYKDPGSIQIPGGSLEWAMALQATAHLNPKQTVSLIHAWETSNGRTFSIHTDNKGHGEDADKHLGCGHVGLALTNPHNYGLKRGEIRKLVKAVTDLSHEGKKIQILTYLDDHLANAVIRNKNTNLVFEAIDGKNAVFRIDDGRIKQLVKDNRQGLANYLKRQGIKVSHKKLLHEIYRHTEASLENLAPGKPVYVAKEKEGKIRLKKRKST